MKLTVLVPCYNAAPYLETLIPYFHQQILNNPALSSNFEVLVADNFSGDSTETQMRKWSGVRGIRYIRYKEHLATVEENIMRAMGDVKAEYTWILGSDDNPRPNAIPFILKAIEEGPDLIQFDCSLICRDNLLRNPTMLRNPVDRVYTDVQTLVCKFGIWFAFAGISNQVTKTEILRTINLRDFIEKTQNRIYSFAFALIAALNGKRVLVESAAIVEYRLSGAEGDHWQKTSYDQGTYEQYFWTTGAIRQIAHLEKLTVLDFDFMRNWTERTDKFFIHAVPSMLSKLIQQIGMDYAMASKFGANRRIRIPLEDIREVCDFVVRRLPESGLVVQELNSIVAEIHDKGHISPKRIARVDELARGFARDASRRLWYVTRYSDYEVFKHCGIYFGIRRDYVGNLEEIVCRIETQARDSAIVVRSPNIESLLTSLTALDTPAGLGLTRDSLVGGSASAANLELETILNSRTYRLGLLFKRYLKPFLIFTPVRIFFDRLVGKPLKASR